jgi:hypothetical protein
MCSPGGLLAIEPNIDSHFSFESSRQRNVTIDLAVSSTAETGADHGFCYD